MEVMNRYVTAKNYIEGSPKESDFEIKCSKIVLSAEPGSNDVVLKNLYVSIDPYQINRFKSYSSSHKTSSNYVVVTIAPGEEDDLVVGTTRWADYSVLKASEYVLRKLNSFDMGFPLSHQIGVFGFSGLTAYAGLFEVGKPKKGERVFVSAASGSVGHLVGQYAKLSGCYVVGCAGSKEKVGLLKEKLGFDDAFNYKDEPNLESTLKKIMIQGFLTTDFLTIFPDFLSVTMNLIRLGRIKTLEDISTGLESIPQAFVGLFHGANAGKKIVTLVEN
ncbi:hypothetical protein F8388_004290 [Cannabis sativa]|uniref:Alcohol dehydrogenase-like C-terminal domain-containing protein n=1 Tax=Cannabis sativa TaxID=3483 RepID=A0A7J6HAI9_CANSA|nr:hypothetical protein F8388_004290 [Cannabis sativa]